MLNLSHNNFNNKIEASHISVEGLGGVYAASFTGSQGSGTL